MSSYDQFMPKRKLNVFISSKCADLDDAKDPNMKYTYVRRELQVLLESTGLFEVYNFDTETASSCSVEDHYLTNLDNSDIVVFLIDNGDGIPTGVRKEEKRARERGINLYYFFCREQSKEKTDIQKLLETSPSNAKFENVDTFREIGEKAYSAILADIKYHYKKHLDTDQTPRNLELQSNHDDYDSIINEKLVDFDAVSKRENVSTISRATDKTQDVNPDFLISINNVNHSLLDKKTHKAPSNLGHYLSDIMLRGRVRDIHSEPQKDINSDEKDSLDKSLIADYALDFLKVVIGKCKFNRKEFDELSTYILNEKHNYLREIVNERHKSIVAYYESDFEEALKHIRKAFNMAQSKKEIPTWYVNDIAIDLRNILIIESSSSIPFLKQNEGREFLQQSKESVYYPLIDRIELGTYRSIMDSYEKEYYQSPYTITVGNTLEERFNEVANLFWIALVNGSLTQLLSTCNSLVRILNMVTRIYDDHVPIVELIRIVFFNNQNVRKNVQSIIRTYHGESDIINPNEAEEIYKSIQLMPIKSEKIKAICEFFSFFSCYCNQDFFDREVELFDKYCLDWIDNEDISHQDLEILVQFYHGIADRDAADAFVRFSCILMENAPKDLCDSNIKRILCQYLRSINYESVDADLLKRLMQNMFNGMNENEYHQNPFFIDAVTQIALFRKEYQSMIAAYLKEAPTNIKDRYEVNVDVSNFKDDKTIDIWNYIARYLDDSDNECESIPKGVYIDGNGNWDIINNILCSTELSLTEDQLLRIIRCAERYLLTNRQVIKNKVACCNVLCIILLNYKNSKQVKELYEWLKDNRDEILDAEEHFFTKDSTVQLKCSYFIALYNYSFADADILMEILSSLDTATVYVQVKCLELLLKALKNDRKTKYRSSILFIICSFALFEAKTNEFDVQYYSVLCLIELIRYKSVRDIAFRRLLIYMDGNNARIRLAIIARISRMRLKNNEYVDAIKQKAAVDYHYLVHKYAE